jgi:hypothetical protein
VTALRLCLERLIPPARERPLDIDTLSDDPAAARGEIIQAVAEGDLLPSEGERLTGMIKAKAELTALRKIEERLAALEAASWGRPSIVSDVTAIRAVWIDIPSGATDSDCAYRLRKIEIRYSCRIRSSECRFR